MSYLSFAREMLGNLFKKPATTEFPVKPKVYYEVDRGRVVNDIDKCIFCGMCQRNCPSNAITIDRNARTWTIQPYACVLCSYCVENCPKKCLAMENVYTDAGTEKKAIVLQGQPAPPKPVLTPEQKAELLKKAMAAKAAKAAAAGGNASAAAGGVAKSAEGAGVGAAAATANAVGEAKAAGAAVPPVPSATNTQAGAPHA